MTSAASNLLPTGKISIDDDGADFIPDKIMILSERQKLKNIVVTLIENRLATDGSDPTNQVFDYVATSGLFSLWTLCAYFPTIYDIAAKDDKTFDTTKKYSEAIVEWKTTGPTKNPDTAVETAEGRLLALFLAFMSMGKTNTTQAAPTTIAAKAVEYEAVGRRYRAMIAGKKLPAPDRAIRVIEALPRTFLDGSQRHIWANNDVAMTALAWVLKSNPAKEADKALVSQMRMIYEGAEMTLAKIGYEFITKCDTCLVTLPNVVTDAEKYLAKRDELKKLHGDQFLHLRLLRHADADSLSPRLYPYLAAAATFWQNRRNSATGVAGALPTTYVQLNMKADGYTADEMQAAHATPIPAVNRARVSAQTLPPLFQAATGITLTAPSGTAAGTPQTNQAKVATLMAALQAAGFF